jgi:hypothetical protein
MSAAVSMRKGYELNIIGECDELEYAKRDWENERPDIFAEAL